MTGLYRVTVSSCFFDAVYWHTEEEAKVYAVRVWNTRLRRGSPLVHYVAPGEAAKSIPIDYDSLRVTTAIPESNKLDELD